MTTKREKALTREQILNIPDAPKGQRFRDFPKKDREFAKLFFATRSLLYEAAEKLTGEKRADFWTRALAALKSTGLPVGEYNRLGWKDEIRVLRAAAKLKKREQTELLSALQKIVSTAKPEPQAELTKPDTPPARIEKAYQSYCWAERESGLTADKDVYLYLQENPIDGYDLPALETWKTYVSRGRAFHKTHKNTPRAGRSVRAPKAADDPDLLRQITKQFDKN